MQDVLLYVQKHPAPDRVGRFLLFIRNSFTALKIFSKQNLNLKKTPTYRSTERLEIRLTPAEKRFLKAKAKKAGFVSMADFIISLAKNVSLRDSRYDKIIFDTLDTIAVELNKTGVNINQATHVLNILKLQAALGNVDLVQFNKFVAAFNQKQDELLLLLRKLRFE